MMLKLGLTPLIIPLIIPSVVDIEAQRKPRSIGGGFVN